MASPGIAGTRTGAVIEDAVLYTAGSVQAIGVQSPQNKFSTQSETPGEFGVFSISAAGQWTYQIDNASPSVQSLKLNQIVTDTFLIDYDSQLFASVTINITGKNDPAVVSGDLVLRLDATQQSIVNGRLKVDDIDAGESQFVDQNSTEGTYGRLTISSEGSLTYALKIGPQGKPIVSIPQAAFEQFTVATLDGTTASVKVSLAGASEAPEGQVITGSSGNDSLHGNSGNDLIDGGLGFDTVAWSSPRSHFAISKSHGAFSVLDNFGSDGRDALVSIERLQFSDKTFELQNLPFGHAPDYGKDSGFLFDGVYYLLANPERVPQVELGTALQDWFSTGAALHKKPNAWFDAEYYSTKWADLALLHLDDATLFMHYNLYGVWEGRSAGPVFDKFDGNRYLADSPDVAAYVDANLSGFLGSRTNGAIAHYIIYGANEQRVAYDSTGTLIDLGYVV